jgi:spore coat protein A
MLSRRQFIWTTAATGVVVSVGGARHAFPFAQSPTNIRKFVTTLPGLGLGRANNIGQYIPLATNTPETFAGLATDVYRLAVRQFTEQMHPDLPKATTFWGYADVNGGGPVTNQYLGGIVVATRGKPVLFHVTNQLPNKAIIPVDPTLMAGPNGLTVGDLPFNRIVTHLHGGFTPWFSDGTPFQWFTPSGAHGISFLNVPGTAPPAGTGTYYYPMDQSARLVWYHDHAIGITRTNAYSGIVSAVVITDEFEAFLLENGLLPDLVGIPLVIQDKSFVPVQIHREDPTWKWGDPGDLWYAHVYEFNSGPAHACLTNPRGRWDYGPCVSEEPQLPGTLAGRLPNPSTVPEFFADTAMVNGAPYPVLHVTDKTFRFRLLNGSQARFWHLNLYAESSTPGEADTSLPGPAMYQVGDEGGFLPAVAVHPNGIPCPLSLDEDESGNTANPDGPFNLLLAPAERADVLIDFTGLAGQSFILFSDAPAPFPGGDPRNDYFTGDPDQTAIGGAPSTVSGYGPNTRTILKIVVGSGAPGPLPSLTLLNMALANNFTVGNPGVDPQQPALLAPFNPSTGQFEVPAGTPIFNKTLNEDFDDLGRLLQRAGTDTQFTNNQGLPTFGRNYLDAVTETVSAGVVQTWDFYNTTGDTHPWHFHLVNVQVVGRGRYNTNGGDDTPLFGSFTDLQGNPGKLTPPDPNEQGWKETVRMNPGEITRVIMRFDLPNLPAVMGDPTSPRTGGHEYVHHCHILEHEEHDMMRPLVVG